MQAKNITLIGGARAQEKLLEVSGLLDMPETLAALEMVITKYQNQNAEAEVKRAQGARRGR